MTREQELAALIDTLYKRHKAELCDKDVEIKALKELVTKGEYAFKGVCGESLSLRFEVSPATLASTPDYRLLDTITKSAAERMAHMVEKRLGDRHDLIKEYGAAREYIHYLQNHAASRGVQFTPFNEKEIK